MYGTGEEPDEQYETEEPYLFDGETFDREEYSMGCILLVLAE